MPDDKQSVERRELLLQMRRIEEKYDKVLKLMQSIKTEQYALMREATIQKTLKTKAKTGIDYTTYNLQTDYNVFKSIMDEIQ